MKVAYYSLIIAVSVCVYVRGEDVRLLDLDPPEAQQIIESKDTSLKYAPKIDSSVPATRFIGNEPQQVLEDIYLANQYHGQDGLGGYVYGYSVPDIAKSEKKQAGGDLRGAYNYINGDGQEIKVEYWDDGTGFHQVDNVPKILPQQIEDSPEVKAAKEEHARIWAAEAERNSKPIEDPYPNAQPGDYAGYGAGVGAGQNQPNPQQPNYGHSQQQQPNYGHSQQQQPNYGHSQQQQPNYGAARQPSFAGSQQSTPRPSFGGSQQPNYGGAQQQSFGASQQANVYSQQPQQQANRPYQQPASGYNPQQQQQQGGRPYSAPQQPQFGGQAPQQTSQFGGQAQATSYSGQAQHSSQFGGQGHQQGGSSQFGGQGHQQGGSSQFGGQGQQQGGYNQPSQAHGRGQGYGSSPAPPHGHGSTVLGGSNQIDSSGQYNPQSYGRNQQDGENKDEEQGPPKGFFYNFDYPVGIIVSKQGQQKRESLQDMYQQNKAKFEQQLKGGAAVHGAGTYPNYQVHS